MQITNSKQSVIAQAILASLSGKYALRTAKALAQESGTTEAEAVQVALNFGCVTKRRRADGVLLYGIEARVHGNDVQHTPVTAWSAAEQDCTMRVSDRAYEEAKSKVVAALADPRWSSRSRTRLKVIANIVGETLDNIIEDLDAVEDCGFVTARDRATCR